MVARVDANVQVYEPELMPVRGRTTVRTTTGRLVGVDGRVRPAVVSRSTVQAEGAVGVTAPDAGQIGSPVSAPPAGEAVQPAAPVTTAAPPTAAATPAAPPAAASALPAAPPGVSEQWTQDRRAAMEEVRAEYRAARDQAERAGQFMRTETQYDESGSRDVQVFDEAAFRAHWQAQAQGSLGVLAGLYGLDQGALVGGRSDVIDLALRGNVGLTEGRAPDGYVMTSAAELADLDAYLYSDMNQVLVLQFGTEPVAPATSGLAQEQVRRYGQARYEMLARLEQAQARIHRDYADALAQARNDPSRQAAGWHDVQVQVQVGGMADESGYWLEPPQMQTVTERRFDVQAFSTWYVSQQLVSNQAFGAMYGIGREVEMPPSWADESGNVGPPQYEVRFTVQLGGQARELVLQGDRIVDQDLVHINLNDPPDLHDSNGVFWHPLVGWSTHHSNIDRGRDWFETIVTIVIVAVAAYFTGGYAASFFAQGSLAAAVAGGAAAGATASAVSGVISGNFSWSNVLRGAAMGAVGGAVANGVTSAAQSVTDSQVVSALQDSGQVVAEGTNVSQVVNGSYQVNTGALGLEANSSIIADAQSTFRVARTVGQVAQGGLMAELGGGDFEDGALSALGTAFGQNSGAEITQALGGGDNPLVSADVARFAGGVVGAGVTSAWVNERGGDGDLTFVNGVVDSAVNTLPQPTREEPRPTWSTNPDDYVGLEDAFGWEDPARPDGGESGVPSSAETGESGAPSPTWSSNPEDYESLADAFGTDTLEGAALSLQPPTPPSASGLRVSSSSQDDSGVVSTEYSDETGRTVARIERDGSVARLYVVDPESGERILVGEAPASAVNPDLVQVGGAGNRAGGRPTIEFVRNGNRDALLDLISDPTGLLGPLIEIRSALGQLRQAQAEALLGELRRQFTDRGLTPPGAVQAIYGDGVIRTDYGATLQRYESALRQVAHDDRMRATWGPSWQNLRIGNAGWSPAEFERQFFDRYQQAVNDGYQVATDAYRLGAFEVQRGQNLATLLGQRTDTFARSELRAWMIQNGIPEGPSTANVFINRQLPDPGDPTRYRIPDLTFGSNGIMDATIGVKLLSTPQIADFFRFLPGATNVMIVRPDELGGSYIIRRR